MGDDTVRQRLLKVAHKSGPSKGVVVDLDTMLPVYYRERGWTPAGVPSPEKLAELGIASA
jgi:aldehyde:ferredoxin oxidoreductase